MSGAEDASTLVADAALDQVEERTAGVAVRLDVRFAKDSREAAHAGMITLPRVAAGIFAKEVALLTSAASRIYDRAPQQNAFP
jgi:hypothetical protein